MTAGADGSNPHAGKHAAGGEVQAALANLQHAGSFP